MPTPTLEKSEVLHRLRLIKEAWFKADEAGNIRGGVNLRGQFYGLKKLYHSTLYPYTYNPFKHRKIGPYDTVNF